MPNRDETGPNGYGPLSGRGFGHCDQGLRKSCGRRRSLSRFSELTVSKEDQKKRLENELLEIEKEKQYIEKKLKETE